METPFADAALASAAARGRIAVTRLRLDELGPHVSTDALEMLHRAERTAAGLLPEPAHSTLPPDGIDPDTLVGARALSNAAAETAAKAVHAILDHLDRHIDNRS